VIREELSRLFNRRERHRRLLAVPGAVARCSEQQVWSWPPEPCSPGRLRAGAKAEIHGFGDAAFFTVVQLLTVSSQIKNPLTSGGKVVDVFLEVWAVFVVTVVAGSFATFCSSGDSS